MEETRPWGRYGPFRGGWPRCWGKTKTGKNLKSCQSGEGKARRGSLTCFSNRDGRGGGKKGTSIARDVGGGRGLLAKAFRLKA